MTDKKNLLLVGSLAANIFLVAFLLGRATLPGLMPPPPPPMEQMAGDMPPPPPPPGADGAMPPPPPFVGPGRIFSREEMKANFEAMKPTFDKMKDTRKAFAEKLKAGSVTKEEALQHFSEMDALMQSVRQQTREKAAEKISAMSEQERQQMAARLLEDRPQHHHAFGPRQ